MKFPTNSISYSRILTLSILFIAFLYVVVFTYIFNQKNSGYILGDWLINYEDGGFKRRGLSGSFFFILQDVTGLSLNILVYIIQFALITIFFYFFYKMIQFKHISWLYFTILFSPLSFLAYFNCVDYVGKKEFILLALYTYFVYQLYINKLSIAKEWLVVIFLTIGLFFHEIVLFFIPYFMFSLFLRYENLDVKRYIKYGIIIIPAIILFLYGGNINNGNSLAILKHRGVEITDGIFFWNINEREYMIKNMIQYRLYIIAFLLATWHFLYFLKKDLPLYFSKKYLLLLALIFCYSLPLFFLAIDWGRWLYIHLMMLVITFTPYVKEKTLQNGNNKLSITIIIILLLCLLLRVEMSGFGLTFEGLFYRVFVVPSEYINKIFP